MDSNYFIRGYAIHGYAEVPTYAASHGCLRMPIPDAPSVYAWVQIGTPVDVYDQGGGGQHHSARQRRAVSGAEAPAGAPGDGATRALEADLERARERLVAELREHALVIGEVTLTSGRKAQYYVDAKRAILRPEGFGALADLLAARGGGVERDRRGGMTMGADAVACAALAGGAKVTGFFVRKEAKAHGLQRRIEGPPLGSARRCLVVEDVVTTGGSTLAAIEALKDEGHEVCGVVSVLDRLAGGGPRSKPRPEPPTWR